MFTLPRSTFYRSAFCSQVWVRKEVSLIHNVLLIHNESMKSLAPTVFGYRLRLPSAPYYYLGDNIAHMAVTCVFSLLSTPAPSPIFVQN